MTPRERVLAAVHHDPTDAVPTDMWAVKEIQELLLTHFDITEGAGEQSVGIGLNGGALSRRAVGILRLWDRMGIDGILGIKPPYIGPPIPEQDGLHFSEWGFGYRRSDHAHGSYDEQVVFPLAHMESIDQLEEYNWPDPDWYDYARIPSLISECEDRAVCCGYSAIFTFHNYLRGLETSLTDPVLEPEITEFITGKLSAFFTEYHRRCFLAGEGKINFTQVTDDWGSQHGLLCSPDVFRRFYKPSMIRAIELAQEFDITVFHHDDGDMRALLPELTSMGISVLNPIQWRCGDWDLAKLKEEYGAQLCFHGGVDNQGTLPFGSAEEVRREVACLIETLGSDNTGYILGPCHNIQANTPLENILAMYDAATSSRR